MKRQSGSGRRFSQMSKSSSANYLKNLSRGDVSEEFLIGIYSVDGQTTGEFLVRWEDFGFGKCPRLEAFDDAWNALTQFGDLLAEMAKVDNQKITPDSFREIMVSLGIEDATRTEL